jgi:transcriptional regulator with XRE-family HTH domain
MIWMSINKYVYFTCKYLHIKCINYNNMQYIAYISGSCYALDMQKKVDLTTASSIQIEQSICEDIRRLRLSRNWTRDKLSQEAGVSARTVANLEEGKGVTFNTIIRIMKAFGIQANLGMLIPDTSIQPIQLLEMGEKERKRAGTRRKGESSQPKKWEWNE